MGAIQDLLKSERGFFAVVLLGIVTVAMFAGHITSDQWIEQIQWISGLYIGSKTVTGGLDILSSKKSGEAPAAAPSVTPSTTPSESTSGGTTS